MRKVNPTQVCAEFQTEVTRLKSFWNDSQAAIQSARDRSLFAELVFHRGYVAVESFLSAWFIGSINRDSSRYVQFRENALRQSITDKFSVWDSNHVAYSLPTHISVNDLTNLIDPDGWNITFKSYERLQQRSTEWLVPEYQIKVSSVSPNRKAIIDAAKAVRNCIAHQSQASFAEMNDQLAALPNAGSCQYLRRWDNSVYNVGSYLKSAAAEQTRIEIYLDEFWSFGADLA